MSVRFVTAIVAFALSQLFISHPSQAQVCPDQRTVSGPQVRAQIGPFKRQSVTVDRQAVYNPPPGCFVLDCRAKVLESKGNTDYSVNTVAAQSSFISMEELDEAYSSAVDLAAELSIPYEGQNLEAKLQAALAQERERHRSFLFSLQSSHQACQLSATARGRGTFSSSGSTIVLSADVDLCCGSSELQSSERLLEYLEGLLKEILDEQGGVPPGEPGSCGTPTMNCMTCSVPASCSQADDSCSSSIECTDCSVGNQCPTGVPLS